jgi:predicted DNA-binding mobile mystery protein A
MDTTRRQSRRALDRELAPYRSVTARARPGAGWIRAIRDALGMSGVDLSRRMGIRQPTLAEIEGSEVAGTIRLETLRRAGEAMDCTLVYALVPNATLDEIVRSRARDVAKRDLEATDQSMRLEAQTPPKELREDLIEVLADQIVDTRRLWATPEP